MEKVEKLEITSLPALFRVRNVTTSALAEATGIPAWNIGLIRTGRMVPFLYEAEKLAKYFGITLAQMEELCGVEQFRISQRKTKKGEKNE